MNPDQTAPEGRAYSRKKAGQGGIFYIVKEEKILKFK